MKYDLTFQESDLLPFLTIILSTFFFSAYWFIFDSKKIKNSFYTKYNSDEASIKHVLFTKYAGLVLMGIIPGLIYFICYPQYTLSDYGISFSKGTNLISLYWILGAAALIFPVSYMQSSRPKTLGMYPQIRAKYWDLKLIIRYSLGWCAYLFGYEFLFRAILFIPLVDTLGVWPAIAINVALYSATHIPKGMDEAIGAAPIGFLLCIATLQTETIWVAYVVHVFLALSNSLFALKHQPEMKIVKNRSAL